MSYVAHNRDWKISGRIIDLRVDGPFLKLILDHGKIQIKYRPEHANIKLYDWVALDIDNHLVKIVDSKEKPLVTATTYNILKNWSHFLKSVRSFFENEDFLEVHTPSLVPCPGTEPSLESFSTVIKFGKNSQIRYLPTSPELHLKKTLTMGYRKIYEISKCYRNNEITPLHQPEFWMLEWYRSFANLIDVQVDVVKFVYRLCDQYHVLRPDIKNFTIRQLFKKYLNFDLLPQTTKEDLKDLAVKFNLRVDESYTQDDLFFLLMIEKIEPELPKDCLVFIEKYPPFQAALARLDFEGWAERFELYWKGMELANAFDELNDPVQQRIRAQKDLTKREGKNTIDLDEEFFQALESGMPPSAGIAFGLERLFMALFDIKKIEELRLFPVK